MTAFDRVEGEQLELVSSLFLTGCPKMKCTGIEPPIATIHINKACTAQVGDSKTAHSREISDDSQQIEAPSS